MGDAQVLAGRRCIADDDDAVARRRVTGTDLDDLGAIERLLRRRIDLGDLPASRLCLGNGRRGRWRDDDRVRNVAERFFAQRDGGGDADDGQHRQH